MILHEDLEESIIESFQAILDKYQEFREECVVFNSICQDNKNLKSESNYLYDFVTDELWDKLKSTKEEILDEFYPIDYADDEEDPDVAGDIYRDSKELRDSIFN